jgi:hypothetical protein
MNVIKLDPLPQGGTRNDVREILRAVGPETSSSWLAGPH